VDRSDRSATLLGGGGEKTVGKKKETGGLTCLFSVVKGRKTTGLTHWVHDRGNRGNMTGGGKGGVRTD